MHGICNRPTAGCYRAFLSRHGRKLSIGFHGFHCPPHLRLPHLRSQRWRWSTSFHASTISAISTTSTTPTSSRTPPMPTPTTPSPVSSPASRTTSTPPSQFFSFSSLPSINSYVDDLPIFSPSFWMVYFFFVEIWGGGEGEEQGGVGGDESWDSTHQSAVARGCPEIAEVGS